MALHVPGDGVIDIAGLGAALARGVRVECGAGVERLEPAGRGARLTTPRGAIEARVVVDAAGAWAGALTGAPPLASFKRHVYVVEATAAAGAPYLWHLGAGEVYVRGDAGGLLVSPCDATATAPADQQPDASGEAALRARLAGSGWQTARIVRSWACQRAFTADRRRLGRDPARPWLVWAAGLGGHGATAVGEVVAEPGRPRVARPVVGRGTYFASSHFATPSRSPAPSAHSTRPRAVRLTQASRKSPSRASDTACFCLASSAFTASLPVAPAFLNSRSTRCSSSCLH